MTTEQAETTGSSAWAGFQGGLWRDAIDVRDFIQANYTPYEGDAAFLAGPTERTTRGLGADHRAVPRGAAPRASTTSTPRHPSSITAHAPGYIDRDRELIVGLQTDAPLKRAIMPNGGWRMVESGLEAYGYEPDPLVHRDLHPVPQDPQRRRVRRLHARRSCAARRAGIITGLPDAYGRGRIIGDYRRVALYGVDRLIEAKQAEKAAWTPTARLDAGR